MAKKNDREEARRKLKERMDKSKQKGSGDYLNTSIFKSDLDGVKFWRVTEDDHWIDIIPYKAGKFDPDVKEGQETYVFEPFMHKNVGPEERDVICMAKTYGKPCAICDRIKKLVAKGEDIDDINFKVQSNPRAIYNIVCYDDDKEIAKGVQIFHTSHFVMEQTLLVLATSEKKMRAGKKGLKETVYYADPEIGKTVAFKRKGKGVGTRYLAHSFEDRDYVIGEDILDQARSLDELVVIPSYEQAFAWLDGEELDSNKPSESTDEDDPQDDVSEEQDGGDEKGEDTPEVDGDNLKTELEAMTKAELRKFIKEEGLEFAIGRGMDEETIIDGILSEMGGSSSDSDTPGKSGGCPGGGTIGKDLDELEHCNSCKVWEECVTINDAL